MTARISPSGAVRALAAVALTVLAVGALAACGSSTTTPAAKVFGGLSNSDMAGLQDFSRQARRFFSRQARRC